jgi:hypothetical protein
VQGKPLESLRNKAASATATLVVASVLLGCPLLKKKGADAGEGDDGDLASLLDAATVTMTGSGAKNEKDVLRYAKEQAVANEPAFIAKDGTKVRTFPGNGAEVATLAKGTNVQQLAKYFSSGVLITWDDADGAKLMGWVPPSALAAPAVAAPTTASPATVVQRPADAGARPADAGARPADAGAVAVDAGARQPAVDAGAGGPSATAISYPPDATGKCPASFVKSGPMCKRRCSIDAECARGTFCVKDPNPAQILKVCSTDKPK